MRVPHGIAVRVHAGIRLAWHKPFCLHSTAHRIQELKPLVYRMMRTGVDTAIELIEPYSEEDSTANYAYN
mgnify:CR=1 FL=1